MKQIPTLLFLLLSLASLSLADGKKPNVLLLMSDDLNTALSGFGHPQCKTPELDKLAERGMRHRVYRGFAWRLCDCELGCNAVLRTPKQAQSHVAAHK